MTELSKIILSSAAFSAVFSGAIIWLFKSLISERLKNAIAYEYDQKAKTIDFANDQKIRAIEHGYNEELEKLRVQLQKESVTANTRLKEELEHDRKIFEKLNAYADETTVRDVVGAIGDNSFYDYKSFHRLSDLEHYGIQTENQFLHCPLREAFLIFIRHWMLSH
jgi:hypothetical protein